MSKEKVQMDPSYILKLTVTLLVTCVVVAACLGGVNAVTCDKIAEINWQKTVAAMQEVVADPENTTFSEALPLTEEMLGAASAYGATLSEAYEAQVNGASAGYALKVEASGSQGTIVMMVGIDTEGAVTGVSKVKNSETKGIGSKVMDNMPTASGVGVLDQFEGKTAGDGELAVGSNVDAITGATVSTRGVTAIVNGALAAAGAMG